MKKVLLTLLLLISITVMAKPWPVKVIWVRKNYDRNISQQWQVMTDRGIMYYTDNKPVIGQIAFCMNDSDEIVKCDCEK
jgi:hypothetical protein